MLRFVGGHRLSCVSCVVLTTLAALALSFALPGAALAAENVRLRGEVARLQSMLADLGGPLAATAADCGSPGRSAEVASSDVTESP